MFRELPQRCRKTNSYAYGLEDFPLKLPRFSHNLTASALRSNVDSPFAIFSYPIRSKHSHFYHIIITRPHNALSSHLALSPLSINYGLARYQICTRIIGCCVVRVRSEVAVKLWRSSESENPRPPISNQEILYLPTTTTHPHQVSPFTV